jgi:hypothetical protein
MKRLRLMVASCALLAAAAICLACSPAPTHQLESITLSPTSADAKDYPNAEVQFVATGHYNISPMTVTPLAASWGACSQQFATTTAVLVSQNGLAQCAAGATGTFTVWVNDPMPLGKGVYSCPAQGACGGGCNIQANAQITCP